jgi:hypothetical protein
MLCAGWNGLRHQPADEMHVTRQPLEASHAPPTTRRKAATIQQTVYLPPAVHDQLRELAFAERVKMHSLLMEATTPSSGLGA